MTSHQVDCGSSDDNMPGLVDDTIESEHASIPSLRESSEEDNHVSQAPGSDRSESDDESDCYSDGLCDLFSPLNVAPVDAVQVLLASLGHVPQDRNGSFAGFRRGFLNGPHGGAGLLGGGVASLRASSTARQKRSVLAQKQDVGTKRKGSTRRAAQAPISDPGQRESSVPNLGPEGGTLQRANVTESVHELHARLADAEENLKAALQEVDSLRSRVILAERAKETSEELYDRAVKQHKANEAELSLLREISHAEKKRERKEKGRQLKKTAAATAPALSQIDLPSTTPQASSAQELGFQGQGSVGVLLSQPSGQAPSWMLPGTLVDAFFYGTWFPAGARVQSLVHEQGRPQVDVLWESEPSRSILELSEIRLPAPVGSLACNSDPSTSPPCGDLSGNQSPN